MSIGAYLKQLYADGCSSYWRERTVQQINDAYENLFKLHTRLLKEIKSTEEQIDGLEKLTDSLRSSEGKDDQTVIKDKWQAIKVGEILEHSRVVRLKLYELIDNTPEKPSDYVR